MTTLRRCALLVGALTLSVLGPRSTWANSKYLNVQGTLTDSSGNPLTGNQTITFRLYTSSTAAVASAIWSEIQTISLSSGVFSVTLGTSTALDSLSFNQLYYLGMQVAGDSNELSPRQQLGASAYAQGSLGDFNVGNNLNVNGYAQFGSGATKSTVTTTGALNLANLLTINAPSNNENIINNTGSSGYTGWKFQTQTADKARFSYQASGNIFISGSAADSAVLRFETGSGQFYINTQGAVTNTVSILPNGNGGPQVAIGPLGPNLGHANALDIRGSGTFSWGTDPSQVSTGTSSGGINMAGTLQAPTVNVTSALQYNGTSGTNGSLSSGQTMCGGTWNNGVYTGGSACSSGAAIAFSTSVVTSGTAIPNSGNSSFVNCMSSTNVSAVATGGNPIILWMSGSVNCGGANPNVYLWLLVNGQYVLTESASNPIQKVSCPGSNIPEAATAMWLVPGLSAATKQICLGAATSGGGGGWSFTSDFQFGFYEAH